MLANVEGIVMYREAEIAVDRIHGVAQSVEPPPRHTLIDALSANVVKPLEGDRHIPDRAVADVCALQLNDCPDKSHAALIRLDILFIGV